MSEDVRLPGTNLGTEVPPGQGLRIKSQEAKELKEGEKIYLMVKRPNEFSVVDEQFKVSRQGDKLVLTPVTPEDEESDKERRRELAKAIVQSHRTEIMEEAINATEEALARKPAEKLERMQSQSTKGAKAKITSKKGCLFLKLGEEETVL